MVWFGKKSKRRAQAQAARVDVPPGDAAPSGNRTFDGPTIRAQALQNRIAQARAKAAGPAAPIVQDDALRQAKRDVQAYSNVHGPGSAAVRSVPGVNVSRFAPSPRVDLLKPSIGIPRLNMSQNIPSPFLQERIKRGT